MKSTPWANQPKGEYPEIIDRVAQAITDYRADPVPTGLREIRPWMTLRYIASQYRHSARIFL